MNSNGFAEKQEYIRSLKKLGFRENGVSDVLSYEDQNYEIAASNAMPLSQRFTRYGSGLTYSLFVSVKLNGSGKIERFSRSGCSKDIPGMLEEALGFVSKWLLKDEKEKVAYA